MTGPPEGLRRRAVGGVRWTSLSGVVGLVLGTAQVIVLARLLSPREMGIAALAVLVLGLAQVVTDLGVSGSVIAKRTEPVVLDTLLWLTVGAGAALGLLTFLLREPVAGALGEPEVAPLIGWAAAAFTTAAIGQQGQALLQRDLQFRRLAVVDVVSRVAGFVAAVVSAALGAGPVAVVLGLVATSFVRAAAVLVLTRALHRPRLRLNLGATRGHLRFGALQVGERILGYGITNADYLIIGVVLGPRALGLYYVAYQLVIKPLQVVNPALTRVAFPVLTRLRDDAAAVQRAYADMLRAIALVTLPALALVAVVAEPLIVTVYGDEWRGSAVLLQLLAGVGALKSLSNPIGALLLAHDRPEVGFWVTLAWLPILVSALRLAAEIDVVAVSAAHLAVVAAGSLVLPFVTRRVLAVPVRTSLSPLLRPALYAGAGAAGAGAVLLLVPASSPAAVETVAALTVGLAATAATTLRLDGPYVRDLGRLALGR